MSEGTNELASTDADDIRSNSKNSNESLSEFHSVGQRVCQVLIPVSLCSIYVTLLVKLSELDVTKSESIMARAWSRLGLVTSTQDERAVGRAMLGSLYLVLIFLALIVAITLIILFVLYMEWHSCLSYYFYIPSLLIMAVISPAYLRVLGRSLSWFSLDLITLAMLTWNFAALGMMSIFGLFAQTPLIIQQLYLIHNSSMVAVLVVNFLPGWAPWMLLGFLVVWDLFAVMAPFGPLNLIVSMAEKSGIVDMPGLVYSTDVHPNDKEGDRPIERTTLKKTVVDNNSSLDQVGNTESNETVERRSDRKSIEEKGVNIGLGDFIFYGLLIGITVKGQNHGEYYTTLATFNSILVGLIATLAILAITRRTLPALPISIALGLIVAGLSLQFIPNLANDFASEQIFI